MKVLPYSIVRLGGESIDNLVKINSVGKAFIICNEILQLKGNLNLVILELSDLFFTSIGAETCDQQRRKLIEFRRDIYNNRIIPLQLVEEVCKSPGVIQYKHTIISFITLKQTLDQRIKEFKQQLKIDFEFVFKELKSVAMKSTNLKRGIGFSSHDLFKKYFNTDLADTKNEKLNISILKYLCRTVTKTSPYSSFTHLARANINYQGDDFKVKRLPHCKRHLTVNIHTLKSIILLLLKYRPFYSSQTLMLNSTLVSEESCFKFLLNTNNTESIQRLNLSEGITFVFEMVNKEKGIEFNDLVNFMIRDFNSTQDEMENYLLELIRIGMLEFTIDIDLTNRQWIAQLLLVLSKFENDDLLKELITILKKLQLQSNLMSEQTELNFIEEINLVYSQFLNWYLNMHAYCGLPLEERTWMVSNLLNGKHTRVDFGFKNEIGGFGHSSRTLFKAHKENLFYEDVTATYEFQLSNDKVEQIGKLFKRLYDLLLVISGTNTTQRFHELFFQLYPNPDNSYTFLDFYEKVYQHKGLFGALKEDYDSQNFDKFKVLFFSCLNNMEIKDTVCFPLKTLEDLISNLENKLISNYNNNKTLSSAIFLQLAVEDNNIRHVVINDPRYFTGMGKLFSRFLYLFDKDIYTDIYKGNEEGQGNDKIYVENSDYSFFNANIHDSLLPNQIELSGIFRSKKYAKRSILLSDLMVNTCSKTKTLCLVDRITKKRVYFYDLSFQSLSGRSGVFKLLQKFTGAPFQPNISIISSLLNEYLTSRHHTSVEVKRFPRILIEDQIVIQRSFWSVDASNLCSELLHQEDHLKYITLLAFQKKWGIPVQVFILVDSKQLSENEKQRLIRSGDYKPFYLNFSNPALVSIFLMYLKKYKHFTISEMYPDESMMIKNEEGENLVSEFIFQWTSEN